MSEQNERLRYLLKEAAKTFEDSSDPFCTEWLSKHEVTGQECYDLSVGIGVLIRGYLACSPTIRREVAMAAGRSLGSEMYEKENQDA